MIEPNIEVLAPPSPVKRHDKRGPRGYWRTSWEKLALDRVALAAGITIALFGLIAVGAPLSPCTSRITTPPART